MARATRYPHHLARYVAARLPHGDGVYVPESVLTSLFETLYFASLKTDEGRPCRCTVSYIDPRVQEEAFSGDAGCEGCWTLVPFEQPLLFNVRTLVKLAEAADPTVSSLAVFSDPRGRLFVRGLVDQELRYADYTALDSAPIPKPPGLFQASINGVGNISVYRDYSLICSLEHNSLVEQYHDVMWAGPVHQMMKTPLWSTFERFAGADLRALLENDQELRNELLTRWLNAVCRILLNIQQYHHGGGLLITPDARPAGVNVKYKLRYDRLPKALVALMRQQIARFQLLGEFGVHGAEGQDRQLPCRLYEESVKHQRQLELHKNEVLGCVRFIASLSKVDGFVMLDRSLVVHGFGVELLSDARLSEVSIAGDCGARARLMRVAQLEEFGTRHRAMMRYCFGTPGTLGFVISQDGDMRAMTRIDEKLVLWENINVQLAFKVERHFASAPLVPFPTTAPMNQVA